MSKRPGEQELELVASYRVGRLSTVDANGQPAVVPFCFAVISWQGEPVVVSAIDEKPKSVPFEGLQRVRNIRQNPAVSFVVDDYNDDWSTLRFVQVTGTAHFVDPDQPGFTEAITALRGKYAQYQTMAIEANPVLWIDQVRAKSWQGGGNVGTRPDDLPSIIQGRRSVRALKSDPVPRHLVEQAIVAAGWAPSPHGRQPWRFSVVESPERKTLLADEMEASWREQLQLDGQDETIVAIRLQKSRTRLLTAPLIVVPSLYLDDLDAYPDDARQLAERTMAVQSLGAAIQNFLLSIYASGLDSGWMCAPLFCPEVVRDALGLPKAMIPQALLPVGYAAADPVRRPRMPLDRLLIDWS